MTERPLYRMTMDGLRPFNTKAQEQAARIKLGEVVELKLTKVRNSRFHALFFAILRLISQNSVPQISEEMALYLAKVGAGCGEWIKTDRAELFAPGSISFAAMDQAAFDEFVRAAIPPLVSRFMRGTAPEAVIREAMELCS